MRTVAAKARASEKRPKFPDELKAWPCALCGVSVIWCKDGRPGGQLALAAIQLAPDGVGRVALQLDLVDDKNTQVPIAYETNTTTAFEWHAPLCKVKSHTAAARPKKVRS